MLTHTIIVDYTGINAAHHKVFPPGSFPHLRVVRRNLEDEYPEPTVSMASVDHEWRSQAQHRSDIAGHHQSLTYVDFTVHGHRDSANPSHRYLSVGSLYYSAPVRRVYNVSFPQSDTAWGFEFSNDFNLSPHDTIGELILVFEPGEVIVPREFDDEAEQFDDFDNDSDGGSDHSDQEGGASEFAPGWEFEWEFDLGDALGELEEWAVDFDPVRDLGVAMHNAIRWATRYTPEDIWDEDLGLEMGSVEAWALNIDQLEDFGLALGIAEEWALDYDNPNDLGYVFRAAEEWALDLDPLDDLDMGFAGMETWALAEDDWETGVDSAGDHDGDSNLGADDTDDDNDTSANNSDDDNDTSANNSDDVNEDNDDTASESGSESWSDTASMNLQFGSYSMPSAIIRDLSWCAEFFRPLRRMIRYFDITVVGAELVPSGLLVCEGHLSGEGLSAMMVAEMAQRATTDKVPHRGTFSTMTMAEWNQIRELIAGPRELSGYVLSETEGTLRVRPSYVTSERGYLPWLPDESLEYAADFGCLVASLEKEDNLPPPSG